MIQEKISSEVIELKRQVQEIQQQQSELNSKGDLDTNGSSR
jgi:hypothetical protein